MGKRGERGFSHEQSGLQWRLTGNMGRVSLQQHLPLIHQETCSLLFFPAWGYQCVHTVSLQHEVRIHLKTHRGEMCSQEKHHSLFYISVTSGNNTDLDQSFHTMFLYQHPLLAVCLLCRHLLLKKNIIQKYNQQNFRIISTVWILSNWHVHFKVSLFCMENLSVWGKVGRSFSKHRLVCLLHWVARPQQEAPNE